MKVDICPGILTHNIEEYVTKLELVEESGSEWAHIDFMDGQFVPNITVMPHEIMSIQTSLKLEAHMMTHRPDRYFSDLTVAGVSRVLLHREVYGSLDECSKALKQAGDYFPEVGVVINIETPLEQYNQLPIHVIQLMGIHPGSSGLPLNEEIYSRIEKVHAENSVVIEIDGGVHEDNIKQLQTAGASRFVISSHLFVANNVTFNLHHFTQLLGGV